mmetsp:Transcript_45636/g.145640  ORF Transcript_45636/g.145640 Transcript_45636/m.145640 type:complete len:536 (-) Transcript_45636:815-2422(-)
MQEGNVTGRSQAMEDVRPFSKLLHDLAGDEGRPGRDAREQHTNPARHATGSVRWQEALHGLLHCREHAQRVPLAARVLRQHELQEVTHTDAAGQSSRHEGAPAGAAEGQCLGVALGARELGVDASGQQVLLQPERHAEVVDVEPAGGVKAEGEAAPAALAHGLGARPQAGVLPGKVHVEQQAAAHDEEAPGRHRAGQVAPEEHVEGVRGADHKLQHLHLHHPCPPHQRHALLVYQREAVVEVDQHLAAAVHSRREVGVPATGVAAGKEPTPHVHEPQEDVEEGHVVELLAKDDEQGVKQLELPAMVLEPEEHTKAVACWGGAGRVPPGPGKAKPPGLPPEAEAQGRVEHDLRRVVDKHVLEDALLHRGPALHGTDAHEDQGEVGHGDGGGAGPTHLRPWPASTRAGCAGVHLAVPAARAPVPARGQREAPVGQGERHGHQEAVRPQRAVALALSNDVHERQRATSQVRQARLLLEHVAEHGELDVAGPQLGLLPVPLDVEGKAAHHDPEAQPGHSTRQVPVHEDVAGMGRADSKL